jgi:hypothetical protein
MNMDWQIETIRAFVVPQKRERYIEAVSKDKRRQKFIAELSHFGDFDPRWIVPIASSSQNSEGILALLKMRGATATCQAISEFKDLDRQEVPLEDTLRKIIGREMGTILCCLPGRLAYFESEDTRFILERTK